MKFLFVESGSPNLFKEFAQRAGIECTSWTLEDFEQLDPNGFDALFFMPGYRDWPELKRRLPMLLKLKNYGDLHRMYVEYIKSDDYYFFQNVVKFKQNHRPRPVALERVLVVHKKHPVLEGLHYHDILPVSAPVSFLPGRGKFLIELLNFTAVRGVHRLYGKVPQLWEQWPALCYEPGAEHIVATFELSRCAEYRFPLLSHWKHLVSNILLHLVPEAEKANYRDKLFDAQFTVSPDRLILPGDEVEVSAKRKTLFTVTGPQKEAIQKTARQFRFTAAKGKYEIAPERGPTTKLVVTDRISAYRKALDNLIGWYRKSGVMAAPDGTEGIFEGFRSFDHEMIPVKRSDCNCEAALLMARYGVLTGKRDEYFAIARNIVQYLLKNGFQYLDKSKDSYGFWHFYQEFTDAPEYIFCNDTSWVALALFNLYEITHESFYLDAAKRTVEAIYRNRCLELFATINGDRLNAIGHDAYYEECKKAIVRTPFVPALYVTAARVLQDEKYLARAIELEKVFVDHPHSVQMNVFPIFMYSQLYRATGNEAYAAELDRRVNKLKSYQFPCGAFKHLKPNSTKTNRYYGLGEMDIIHKADDEVAEILYVNGPAAYSMSQAWDATGREDYMECHRKQLDFLVRIQIKDNDRRLNGAWMRSYDLRNHDWYGSNSDTDWGPFCVESGWCNTWIGKSLCHFITEMDGKAAEK